MPSPFAGLGLAIDKPGRVLLTHPKTGAPLRAADGEQAWIDILSYDSHPAQDHRYQRSNREMQERAPLDAKADFLDAGEQLAKMTVGWMLCGLDGVRLEAACTFDNASGLYNSMETRWVRNQVMAFVSVPGNFLPAS